ILDPPGLQRRSQESHGRRNSPWLSLIALTKREAPGRIKKPHCMKLRRARGLLPHTRARVAELADALASGASDRKVVEVRVLSRAPFFEKMQCNLPRESQFPAFFRDAREL